jgi:diadenosine tetraphosphate (Ap4A) HIT family hydrolase
MDVILCPDCPMSVDAGDIVGTWSHWHVVVNHNQNYLGKLMLCLRRHEKDVTALTDRERAEFWSLLTSTREALDRLFQPDHYNYAFLMNQDRHVHLHVIPRYANPREFSGQAFTDGRLGEHYQLTVNRVSAELRHRLAEALRGAGLKV